MPNTRAWSRNPVMQGTLEALTDLAVVALKPHFGIKCAVKPPHVFLYTRGSAVAKTNPKTKDATGISIRDIICYNLSLLAECQKDMQGYDSLPYISTVGEEVGHYLHEIANPKVFRTRRRKRDKQKIRAYSNLIELVGSAAGMIWCADHACMRKENFPHIYASLDTSHYWGYLVANELYKRGMPIPLKTLARCKSWEDTQRKYWRYVKIEPDFTLDDLAGHSHV